MKNNFTRNLTNATNWYKMKGGTYIDYITDLTKKSEKYLNGRDVSAVTANLYKQYKSTGITSLRDTIILCNIKLIIDTSVKEWTPKFDLQDLIQEGVIGSIQAIERYDEGKGAKISAYMTIWVRKYIGMHMESCAHIIKYPWRTHVAANKVAKQKGTANCPYEILQPKAERSGANKGNSYLDVIELSKEVVPILEEENVLMDKIHNCIHPVKEASPKPDRADIQEVFNKLPIKQQELVASYYKLTNWLPGIDSFTEVCKKHGIPQTTAKARIHVILNNIKNTAYAIEL